MLAGLDDAPAELPGFGHIIADVARNLARRQTAGQWRFAITDETGALILEGITRYRPHGWPAQRDSRAGIVEIAVPATLLARLASHPEQAPGWEPVIADIARQDQEAAQRADDAASGPGPPRSRGSPRSHASPGPRAPGPRAPGMPLRRHLEIYYRYCLGPGCRCRAHASDMDHDQERARGGATTAGNLRPLCRHDHRTRHEGGISIGRRPDGCLEWISRLGHRYKIGPPKILTTLPQPIPGDHPSTHENLGGNWDDDLHASWLTGQPQTENDHQLE